jgi:hypothetical protein
VLQNLREQLEHPTKQGEYQWDYFDGLQGDDPKDCLPLDAQEKVKRCVEQGFIDPEDWKGVGKSMPKVACND